jgi:type I restriction-modification system DNA methylase subunit
MGEEIVSRQPKYEFSKLLDLIARRKSSPLDVFRDFVTMSACALAVQTREEEYLDVAKKYDREELNEFGKALGALTSEMEEFAFSDILGPYFCEINSKSGRDQRGEFYTPPCISTMMAKMSVNVDEVVERGRPFTIGEPACGSGGMVLAIAEEFARAKSVDLMRVTAQDISRVGCDMAYVNFALWGIPARIIWGDTLRETVNAEWKNIHWARVGEDRRIAIKKAFELVREEPSVAQVEAEPDVVISSPQEDRQQQWLFGGPDVS